MKRGQLIVVFLISALLIAPIISANIFSDFWDNFKARMTGNATSGTASLSITVGNSAPTIPFVQAISATNPTDDTTTSITFNFTATDIDGAGNIDTSTTNATFLRSGEALRTNTSCVNWASSGNDANFTCTIDMWYYDQNGAWTVNVSIQDINDAMGVNSSTTFTYNSLNGMKMAPTALTWPGVSLTNTDVGSDNDPIQINNTGNTEPKSINITAKNLQGETITTHFIYANNFTVQNASEGCSGTAMVNSTDGLISTNVTSAILYRGNHSLNNNDQTSGQEQIYFCLKGVPQDISAQSYSSSAYGAWVVTII